MTGEETGLFIRLSWLRTFQGHARGGRWSAVAGALQFAELLEEDGPRSDSASYVTAGSHDTFED